MRIPYYNYTITITVLQLYCTWQKPAKSCWEVNSNRLKSIEAWRKGGENDRNGPPLWQPSENLSKQLRERHTRGHF